MALIRFMQAPDVPVEPDGARNPRALWTPVWQAGMERMRAENHPAWQLIQSNADKTGTSGERYGDKGEWCTLVYQVTKDVTYARRAWAKIEAAILPKANGANTYRWTFQDFAIMVDWLWPALTPAEQGQAIAKMRDMTEWAWGINTTGYEGGTNLADSDQTVANQLGTAVLATVFGPEDPSLYALLEAADRRSGRPVGGLDATGANRDTARNAIREYVEVLAAGGGWFESAMYNYGTVKNLLLLWACTRTAAGDHYPEIAAWLPKAMDYLVRTVTPDLRQAIQWADEQDPRVLVKGDLVDLLMVMVGVSGPCPERDAAQSLLDAMVTTYGWAGTGTAEPGSDGFFVWAAPVNPPAVAWNAVDPMGYAHGIGHLVVRTDRTLFHTGLGIETGCHHNTGAFGGYELYRDGQWVVTLPKGYGGPAVEAVGSNSLILAGLGTVTSVRQYDAPQSGSDWWAHAGTASGPYYPAGTYYNPPPDFLNRWSRVVLYHHGADADVIVVRDDCDFVGHPQDLEKFARYRAADQALMSGAPLAQIVQHTPAESLSWDVAGQPVTLHQMTPATVTFTNESALWPTTSNYRASEKKFHARLVPSGLAFVALNVLVVGTVVPIWDGTTLSVAGRSWRFPTPTTVEEV